MPVSKSPKKMMRRDAKARMRNRSKLTALKTQRKKFETAFAQGAVTDELFRETQGRIARAGQQGIIPVGRARRLVGQIMKKMNNDSVSA